MSALQQRMRKLMNDLISVSDEMNQHKSGQFDDVKDTTFQMRRIAVQLSGMHWDEDITAPPPPPSPRSSRKTLSSDVHSTGSLACTPVPPSSGSAK